MCGEPVALRDRIDLVRIVGERVLGSQAADPPTLTATQLAGSRWDARLREGLGWPMAQMDDINDSRVAVRVYQALRDAAGPGDKWDIEIALLEQWMDDFGLAIDHAESDNEAQRAREAIEAARALRRPIMAHVAAPGAEDDKSEERMARSV
jgi:hypothetical protein